MDLPFTTETGFRSPRRGAASGAKPVRRARIALALSVGLLAAELVHAQGPTAAATPVAPLRLATPVRPLKLPSAVYIVELKQAAAAAYRGGISGFAATKPAPGQRLDAGTGTVQTYVKHLELLQDRVLQQAGLGVEKIHSFRYAFNGFSARLDAAQASRLARHPDVARVWPDTEQTLRTNNSSIFLGLEDTTGGLRADLGLTGENVVIGIIDSGIAPNHPSLADTIDRIPRHCQGRWATASWLGLFLCSSVRRNPPQELVYGAPENFQGICQAGEGFAESDCNHKLVGARYYIDGFLARNYVADEGEFISPRDADGHGTHIASIAAGNSTTAHLFGTRLGRVSGIAPRARVAVYKACWLKEDATDATCTTSDLTRAIDDAVADGVDIISYSVGSLETDLTAPDDIALLNALDAGILASVAAGNDGPNRETIGSPSSAPWVLTVAASTQSGTAFEEAIRVTEPTALAGLLPMREASFTAPLSRDAPIEEALVLVDDGQDVLVGGGLASVRDACEPLLNANDLDGRVALIERGGCEFQVKLTRVQQAGAIAAVVYNNAGAPIEMRGDAGSVSIPAVMIGSADGEALVDALVEETEVRVELRKGEFATQEQEGNRLAEFSSRGPSLSEIDFVKPDVTAPGVDILGAHTPDAADGLKGETFQYLSGTSMAAPQVAGIAALLKEAHPDWSPGALKSTLMTTARRNVLLPSGSGQAGPFEVGAGHVNANAAHDPGLVYDTGFLDHIAYLCGLSSEVVDAEDCSALAAAGLPTAARELNLPSLGVSALISGDTVTRRVTNLGAPATWSVETETPLGIDLTVTPSSLMLGTGQVGQFTVQFDRTGAPLDTWTFGRVTWTDGTREIGAPVALQPVTLRAPGERLYSGSAGSADLPIAFGYSGTYTPTAHGLRAPLVFDGFVANDPTKSFSFRDENGVTMHLVDLPEDQLFARFALFDELTDGDDDLDLYLYYCPSNDCTQVGESGGFTSEETIDLTLPPAGLYAVLVHGFETDDVAGGLGAEYALHAWSFGLADQVGNFTVLGPEQVTEGERANLALEWSGLAPSTRYLGAVSHTSGPSLYAFSVIGVDSP